MFPIAARLLCALSFSVFACVSMMAQTERPAVIQQIRSHSKGLAVWWMGNAGWLIKGDNVLIGIDLDLSRSARSMLL